VKTNVRDLTFQSGGVNFSNDHSMAWDHGTFSQTSDGPKRQTGQDERDFPECLGRTSAGSGRWCGDKQLMIGSPVKP